jgi:AcrR family transcriptional regulator
VGYYTESRFRFQGDREIAEIGEKSLHTGMATTSKTPAAAPRADEDVSAPAPVRALRADARRNRQAVLAAARERLAEDGLDGPIEDIARAAGVGVGTVYRHFPSKRHLVAALVRDRFERIAERTEEALTEEDPWEAFCDLMRFCAELQIRDRALSQFVAQQPELGRAEAVHTGLAELTAQLIVKAQRSGGMRKDAVVEDVPTLLCALGAVTTHAAGTMPELNWERYVEIMLDGLRAPGSNKLPPPRASIPR